MPSSNLSKPRDRNTIFPYLLVGYEVVNYLSIDAYLPAMPTIEREFSVSSQSMQLTLIILFLGNIVAQLIAGTLSKKYGRRTLLIRCGGVLFIVATLLSIMSTGIKSLLIARFLQGGAITLFIISCYSTIHVLYHQSNAVKIIAWMSSVSILSPALGPLLGAFILKIGGWRWIFAILLVFACAYLVALAHFMPETVDKPTEHRQENIFKQYWSILKDWRFIKPMLAWCSLYAVMISWSIVSPFFVINSAHYDATTYGLMQALVLSAFIAGTRIVGYLLEKYPLNTIAAISGKIAGITGPIGLLLTLFCPYPILAIILFILPLMFSLGLGFAVFNRQAVESNSAPLDLKIVLSSFCINCSAFLTSIIVTSFFSQSIVRFSLFLFLLSLITFASSHYKTKNERKK